MPRFTLPSARAALARPAVLVAGTSLTLATLLGGGLLVANATGADPKTTAEAPASSGPSDAGATSPDGTGSTTSGGDDNVAVARGTRDGDTVYAIRLKVRILNNDPDTVDSGNAAVAVASCTDCQTVAIALEGVVVTGDAEVVAPVNIALAINSGCTNCQTLAYAYQNLQTVDGKARMTGDGRRRVAQLRQELNALRSSGLDILAVRAEVNRIAGEFAEVLRTTIIPLSRPADPSPGATSTSSVPPTPAADSTPSEPSSTLTTPADEPAADDPAPQQDGTATPRPSAGASPSNATTGPSPAA